MMSSANRTRDYFIYIGISVLVLAGIVISAISGVPKDTFSRWYAFIMFSTLLFGQFVLSSQRYWKQSSFWVWTGVAALGHSAAFTWIVRSGLHLGIWGWIICVTIETAVLMAARATLSR
jgi:hypothetical protein